MATKSEIRKRKFEAIFRKADKALSLHRKLLDEAITLVHEEARARGIKEVDEYAAWEDVSRDNGQDEQFACLPVWETAFSMIESYIEEYRETCPWIVDEEEGNA
jgi:hypothetical protein